MQYFVTGWLLLAVLGAHLHLVYFQVPKSLFGHVYYFTNLFAWIAAILVAVFLNSLYGTFFYCAINFTFVLVAKFVAWAVAGRAGKAEDKEVVAESKV